MMTDNPVQMEERAFLYAFFKVLADPTRLQIAGRLAAGPATTATLAGDLGIPLRDMTRQLRRLVEFGIVLEQPDGGRGTYYLAEGWLRARSAALLDSPRTREQAGATDERTRVLASFLRDGRLISIPTHDQRKLVVLSEIAGRFQGGRTYDEREVNEILKEVYEYDYVTLRRMLVDYHFLNREHGVYWVSEGRREEPTAPLPPSQDQARYTPRPSDR